MEQTSPLSNTPIPPQMVTTPPINSPSSNKNVLIILLIVFVVVLISLNAYLFMKLQNSSQTPVIPPAPIVQASPTPTLLPAEASAKEGDPTANWKTFNLSNRSYSFKYPSDWSLEITDYENAVFLANEKKSVGIVFSDSQYPYGFAGPDFKLVESDISVLVGKQTITTKELRTGPNNAFVDLVVKNPKTIHILFGTGYPVASVGDSTASLSDYLSSKETILKILSTFKFLE